MKIIKKLLIIMICSILLSSCTNKIGSIKNIYHNSYNEQNKIIDSLKNFNIDIYRLCEDEKVGLDIIAEDCKSVSTPIFKLKYSNLKSSNNNLEEIFIPVTNKFYLNSYYNKQLIGNYILTKKTDGWEGGEFNYLKNPLNKNSTFLQAINKFDLVNKNFFYINYFPNLYVIAFIEKREIKIIRFMQVSNTEIYNSFDDWVKGMGIDKIDISKVDNKLY